MVNVLVVMSRRLAEGHRLNKPYVHGGILSGQFICCTLSGYRYAGMVKLRGAAS